MRGKMAGDVAGMMGELMDAGCGGLGKSWEADGAVEEALFRRKMDLYVPEETLINTSFGQQQVLLSEIMIANVGFQEACSTNAILKQREQVIGTINASVGAFEELYGNLQDGARFYTDLTLRVRQLGQTVADHCFGRDLEKKEMMNGFQNAAQSAAQVGSSGSNTRTRTTHYAHALHSLLLQPQYLVTIGRSRDAHCDGMKTNIGMKPSTPFFRPNLFLFLFLFLFLLFLSLFPPVRV